MARFHTAHLRTHHVGPVSLSCPAGQCLSIQGPSGSGKTLLLRAMADLDPHDGALFVDGTACADHPAAAWRSRVSLVMAESQWWFDTIGEHFAPGLDETWLEQLGLPPAAMNWNVARCSTGERQRLALLRSLQGKPAVLLLDEPTGNLDQESTARVEALLNDYRVRENAALIWVSHDERQIARVAQAAFVLRDGQLHERDLPCT